MINQRELVPILKNCKAPNKISMGTKHPIIIKSIWCFFIFSERVPMVTTSFVLLHFPLYRGSLLLIHHLGQCMAALACYACI